MLIPYPKKVEQGKALVYSWLGRESVRVSFTGAWIWPLHKVEEMDISVKTIELDRSGSDGLICRDNIRADIKVTFFIKVEKDAKKVLKVAQTVGCARASNQKTLEELFIAKFSEALKTAGKQLDFEDLYTKREEFRDRILDVIGEELNGYSLEDCAIDYLEQTPLSELDRDNILDAQGIRKITELTAIEHVSTNDFLRNEEKQIKKQDVEAAEAIYELERQQADAESKQKREIESVRAREQAETLKVQEEERLKAETARIKADEDIAVQEENKQRQVEVAQKNRERVVAVETERVEKDRLIEVISRERETELQRIAKDKEVENERREIANVIRERIAVDKTVAEQEEAIKRLRVVEEAERTRDATVIAAEAEAQEKLVKDIKAAEAAEKAAEHQAKARVRLADAERDAAGRQAEGKKLLADGIRAETAATGLAEVEVKDRSAEAIEKVGLAEARVLREKGLAEGEAIREKIKGEAEGLQEKARAMAALDERSRQHEEYRIRLEMERAVELAEIEARREVAEAQATVLSDGLKNAKIDIIGGESMFLDRLVNAVSMGKSVDSFMRSDGGRTLFKDYLDGDASFTDDLKSVLARPSLSTGNVRDLTLAAFLGKAMSSSEGDDRSKLNRISQLVQKLGLDQVKVGDLSDK